MLQLFPSCRRKYDPSYGSFSSSCALLKHAFCGICQHAGTSLYLSIASHGCVFGVGCLQGGEWRRPKLRRHQPAAKVSSREPWRLCQQYCHREQQQQQCQGQHQQQPWHLRDVSKLLQPPLGFRYLTWKRNQRFPLPALNAYDPLKTGALGIHKHMVTHVSSTAKELSPAHKLHQQSEMSCWNSLTQCIAAVDDCPVTCACVMQACLAKYCEEEVVSAEDGWNCCQCHRMGVTATKQLSVSRLPSVLVIHLARFDARGNKVSFIVQMLSSAAHLCCSVLPLVGSCQLTVPQLPFGGSCPLMLHVHALSACRKKAALRITNVSSHADQRTAKA